MRATCRRPRSRHSGDRSRRRRRLTRRAPEPRPGCRSPQRPKASSLPALTRAWKLQAKASTVGFDWNDARLVLDKVREETAEVEEALAGGDKAAVQEEIGDLLFVLANLARHVDADPEACLKAANAKFERRFAGIEAALERQGREPRQATLEELEELWQQVKRAERASP